ncbi:MAG: SGNH/GDSL hydrolase family protein [Caldithrix sp.]|nr:MAG: SGNH/GDSL hydrolase family protein [Caldithrix sp.]
MNKWVNYILLTASIFITILFAEFLLRVFIPEIGWAQREDKIIGWSNDEYMLFEPTGRENQTEKRILFLGDSYLAGSGISDLNKRFPILLESMLNNKVTARILAAGGWGTGQQLLAFKQKGKFFEPDLVIVAFCANNDISNILSHNFGLKKLKPYFVIGKDERLELYDGYGTPINYQTIFRDSDKNAGRSAPLMRSYLVDYLKHILNQNFFHRVDRTENFKSVEARYRKFRFWEEKPEEIYRRQNKLTWSPQNGVNHVSAYIHEDFKINTYQWRLLEKILFKLKKEVQSSGGKLAVLLLPVIFNPEDPETIAGGSFVKRFQTPEGYFTFRSDEPRERLRSITARIGIAFYEPTQEFIKFVVEKDLMKRVWPNPKDKHFSALGHEILANLLKKMLD